MYNSQIEERVKEAQDLLEKFDYKTEKVVVIASPENQTLLNNFIDEVSKEITFETSYETQKLSGYDLDSLKKFVLEKIKSDGLCPNK